MGKVKTQLLDEQEHDQFMRDQEPDFDDYALAMKAKEKDDQHEKTKTHPFDSFNYSITPHLPEMRARINEWNKANDEGTHCENCEHCELTRDAYGTGDSPTMRECTADDPSDCPGLMK